MSPATLSLQRRLDEARLMLMLAAAAYAVTRLRPTSIKPATRGRPPDHGLTGRHHRLDHRGGTVGDANRDAVETTSPIALVSSDQYLTERCSNACVALATQNGLAGWSLIFCCDQVKCSGITSF